VQGRKLFNIGGRDSWGNGIMTIEFIDLANAKPRLPYYHSPYDEIK